jgi:hypothetical protein
MSPSTSQSDFTGVWKLNPKKSVIPGRGVEQMLVKLEHHQSTLIQHILLADEGGEEQRLSLTYEIGAETSNAINGAAARTLARWQGTELVIETRVESANREIYLEDHWSLSSEGSTLTMEHRNDALAGQVAVFERAQTEACRFAGSSS